MRERRDDCAAELLDGSLIDGGFFMDFDEDQGAECVAATRNLADACFDFDRGDSCDNIWVGLLRAGEPCQIDSECRNDLRCTAGECLATVSVGEAERCGPDPAANVHYRCHEGFECVNLECEAADDNARCTTPGTCTSELGQTCDTDFQCVTGFCVSGLCSNAPLQFACRPTE